jgi:hypothetical protein
MDPDHARACTTVLARPPTLDRMIRSVGVFLCVWASWSFLDETVLQFHPWAEVGAFAAGVLVIVSWNIVHRHVAAPVGTAMEGL